MHVCMLVWVCVFVSGFACASAMHICVFAWVSRGLRYGSVDVAQWDLRSWVTSQVFSGLAHGAEPHLMGTNQK